MVIWKEHYMKKNIQQGLTQALLDNIDFERELVILCIGTDRSTGDSLGPLVGHYLVQAGLSTGVYGTLEHPIHAFNLEDCIGIIKKRYDEPFFIAIDSGLGRKKDVGMITVENTPLKPGTSVNKVLPEIGDIGISGIVNIGGYMEYLVLQSTRLSKVMKMARVIADSLKEV